MNETGSGPYDPRLAITEVLRLHSERRFSGEGYGWSVCVECRQSWPCATVQAIERS